MLKELTYLLIGSKVLKEWKKIPYFTSFTLLSLLQSHPTAVYTSIALLLIFSERYVAFIHLLSNILEPTSRHKSRNEILKEVDALKKRRTNQDIWNTARAELSFNKRSFQRSSVPNLTSILEDEEVESMSLPNKYHFLDVIREDDSYLFFHDYKYDRTSEQ